MADPVGAITSGLHVVKKLYVTVERYRNRDRTLKQLQNVLQDLKEVLAALEEAVDTESSVLNLLQSPLNRCSQVCHEFDEAMKSFRGKSKTDFVDWTKMEFKKGDINEFINTIDGYKATISVTLGIIIMKNTKVTQHVLEEYQETIQDATYNLNMQIRRIDEKILDLPRDSTRSQNSNIDLQDERAVTKQCLLICQDATAQIEELQRRQSSMRRKPLSDDSEIDLEDVFEAEIITNQALSESFRNVAKATGNLSQRLDTLITADDPQREQEKIRLQEDIDASKRCLEVCKEASSQASRQKIHVIGEVSAHDDTDQVVITTLADLFKVKKVSANDRSAQLVGSLTSADFQKISESRYNSRFGTVSSNLVNEHVDIIDEAPKFETQTQNVQSKSQGMTADAPRPPEPYVKPYPNEVRRRVTEGELGQK